MKKIVFMSICMLIGLISMSFGQRRVAFKSNLGDYMKPANNGVLVFEYYFSFAKSLWICYKNDKTKIIKSRNQ